MGAVAFTGNAVSVVSEDRGNFLKYARLGTIRSGELSANFKSDLFAWLKTEEIPKINVRNVLI